MEKAASSPTTFIQQYNWWDLPDTNAF